MFSEVFSFKRSELNNRFEEQVGSSLSNHTFPRFVGVSNLLNYDNCLLSVDACVHTCVVCVCIYVYCLCHLQTSYYMFH